MEITEDIAKKVLAVVDAGLVSGLGIQEPGKMCVEAAVCYALGLPHGDNPPCVGSAVRAFKIRLNDSAWSSNKARTAGMRKLSIAQLGSNKINQHEFSRLLAEQVIRQIVPIAMRSAASICKDTAKAMGMELAAIRCEEEGTEDAARTAQQAAYAYAAANAAAANANANATANAAYAAAYAANAAANAAAYGAPTGSARLDLLIAVLDEYDLITGRECVSPIDFAPVARVMAGVA
jgi:hypothetical protein